MSEPSVPNPTSLEDVSRRRTAWARGAPVALTVVIFLLIFWRIPFGAFWNALAGARILPFLALMGSFSLCFFLLDTFVLSRLIRWFHGPLPYRDLLPVRAVTYLVSILNTQLAQAALALYIHRRFRTPLAQITSTVALMILLETTNLILFATVGAIAFPGGPPLPLLALPLALGIVWLLVMSLARGKLGILSRRVSDSALLSTFRQASLRHCAIVLGLKGSVFCLALLVHNQALAFFGIDIPLVRLVTFLPVIFLLGALPITVAHLGTSQAGWIFFFSSYASEADLLAYSLVSHLTFMLANGTFGVLFLPKAYGDLFLRKRMD
jgi:Lysylphosphatidylglycerol synthase TM region